MTSKVLAVVCLFACGHERTREEHRIARASLSPAKDASIRIMGAHQILLASARLPERYEFQEIDGIALASGPRNAPQIRIHIGTSESLTQRTVDLDEWIDADCRSTNPREAGGYLSVREHSSTNDGFVNVCVHRDGLYVTEVKVVRRWDWVGHPVQCSVAFPTAQLDPEKNTGEIDPSDSRIHDAVGICMSVRLQLSDLPQP